MATGQSQTTDTLVLNVCQTAVPVNAQFIVTVNGLQVGGVQTATALYTNGTDVPAPITLTGNFGPNPTVALYFLNGQSGAAGNLNLFILSTTLNGQTYATRGAMYHSGDGIAWSLDGATATAITPPPLSTVGTASTLTIVPANAVLTDGASGTTPFTFTVTRSGNTAIAATASWAVAGSGSSPASATDFAGGVLPSGTVSFAAGQTSQTITVNVAANTVTKAAQGFTVTLSNPSTDVTLATASAAGSILPITPDTLAIAATNAVLTDGSSGSKPFTFTVTRTGDVSTAISTAWAVAGSGTSPAVAADFAGGVLPSGTISFAAGQTSQTITINVAGGTVTKIAQNFTVALSNPSPGVTIATASATGSILPMTTDTLVLNVCETAFPVNAQFYVTVDGQQVGGVQTATALYNKGTDVPAPVTLTGSFGSGPHTVALYFANAQSNSSANLNLFLLSTTLDGQIYATSGALYHEGDGIAWSLNGGVATSVATPAFAIPGLGNSGGGSGGGSSGPGGGQPGGPVVTPVAVPQVTAGNLVSLTLQNTQTTALAAREITFGQTFADGQLASGSSLFATINGVKVAVQMDVKSTWADGSVRLGVLTLEQPALAAGASAAVLLALGSAGGPTTPINIAALTQPGAYNFAVALALHNANGTTTNYTFNAASLLASALAAGTTSTWLQGPQATQVRIDTPVAGSLHLTFDITLYADGSISTDVGFNNDLAMTNSGGEVKYDATVTQNGATVFQQANISQFQYQDWNQTFWTNGNPLVNVVHDTAAMQAAGIVPNYDTSNGIASSLLATEQTQMAAYPAGVLGPASITQYMPETGLRPDIGPQPQWNVVWLETGAQPAAQFALDQANAAGSAPWSFATSAGNYVSVTTYPNFWLSGTSTNGSTLLTQPVAPSTQTGWTTDAAHEPDLSYLAYLQTGNRVYLDQLNAEADFSVLAAYPGNRDGTEGLVVSGALPAANGQPVQQIAGQQVRAQAWSLREIIEAAVANPAGSSEHAYFTQIATNNINAMLTFATQSVNPASPLYEGQLAGWVTGENGDSDGSGTPWQQDYMCQTIAMAAELGIPGASQILTWETNYIAGRFLNSAQGGDPFDGANYGIYVGTNDTSTYTTWAQVNAATVAEGFSGNGTFSQTNADYLGASLASLADIVSITGSTEAMQAYGWLLANTATIVTPGYYQSSPTYDIVPRLSDGQLLTAAQVFLSDDTAAKTVSTGTNTDQLIYETGPANVTLQGGSGIDLLFGGSGATTLIGGASSDQLFAGTGATTFEAGPGNNFMQAGAGAGLFMLAPTDIATDMIAGFKLGTDHITVTGETPASLAAIIASATADSSGNAVLHISTNHTATLLGIAVNQVNPSLFV